MTRPQQATGTGQTIDEAFKEAAGKLKVERLDQHHVANG